MSEENQYIEQRLLKANEIRKAGGNPYPNGLVPNALCQKIIQDYDQLQGPQLDEVSQVFSIAGRVIFRRTFGKAGFLKIKDRTGELQVFCQKDSLDEESFHLFQDLDIGDFFFVEGRLFRTKTNELSIKATSLKLVTKSLRSLPEKWHGLTDVEVRYRQRYVDLIANSSVRETFVKRSRIVQYIRQFLVERDFLEVETPMMHPIPGGAAAKPFITHHNKLDMELYLRIAPELYLKRLVVGGLERVFEINRNFRNEGISVQHNPEFTMLEFYQSYATFEDLILLSQELLGGLALEICGSHQVVYQDAVLDFSKFHRLGLKQSLIEIGGLSPEQADDVTWLRQECEKAGLLKKGDEKGSAGVYQTLLFEHRVEKKLIQPTFITDFPIEVSPLSRRNDTKPELAERFELYIFGREIANAFSELNDPVDQKNRFMSQVEKRDAGDEEAMYFDADYIRALEYGMPPTAGEGIGIDRLVMLFTNQASIRDVILFPQMKKETIV